MILFIVALVIANMFMINFAVWHLNIDKSNYVELTDLNAIHTNKKFETTRIIIPETAQYSNLYFGLINVGSKASFSVNVQGSNVLVDFYRVDNFKCEYKDGGRIITDEFYEDAPEAEKYYINQIREYDDACVFKLISGNVEMFLVIHNSENTKQVLDIVMPQW